MGVAEISFKPTTHCKREREQLQGTKACCSRLAKQHVSPTSVHPINMQMQNKYRHLHYLICLGSGLRKANSDITHDALPDQMQDQLRRLKHTGDDKSRKGGDDNNGGRVS